MPPNRAQTDRKSIKREGGLLLAIQVIKNKEISSLRSAAFQVPRYILRRRLRGITNRIESRASGHKLTQVEEDLLKQWILSIDTHRAASRPSTVRGMANILLLKCGSISIQTVGLN